MSRIPIEGTFATTDATVLNETTGRIAWSYPDPVTGAPTAVVLGENDSILIEQITASIGTSAQTLTIFDGSDYSVGAGERLAILRVGTVLATLQAKLTHQRESRRGTYPKVSCNTTTLEVHAQAIWIRR